MPSYTSYLWHVVHLTKQKDMVGWRTSSIRRQHELPKVCISSTCMFVASALYRNRVNHLFVIELTCLSSTPVASSSCSWWKVSTYCLCWKGSYRQQWNRSPCWSLWSRRYAYFSYNLFFMRNAQAICWNLHHGCAVPCSFGSHLST